MKPVRDLLKHSSIYMVGQILTRMASVLLLPLYTHKLSTADFGVTAILDLTSAILATFLAGGMVSAITRHHFDQDGEEHHNRVWWTGLLMVAGVCSVVCGVMYLGRGILAEVTLGSEVPRGAWFYALTIATLWCTVVGLIFDSYLRVMKKSVTFVVISLGRLLLNIGLNVWLLVGLNMGVEGLLIGNLTASLLHTAALACVFFADRGRPETDRKLGMHMLRFAAPLVIAALAGMLMHEADRYFLRIFLDMDQVGIYSLAHKIGFAVHTLCILPFLSIWHVAIYDIERLPNADQMYARIFEWFVAGFGILLLGAALTVHPVLPLLTPDAYGTSVELISVILLGFFVFGLAFMFEVPSLLTKRTRLMVPGSVAGLITNVAANFLLIPRLGVWGAAWAGVITYAVYSAAVLACCRTAGRIPYRWGRSGLTFASLSVAYLVVRHLVFPHVGTIGQIVVSVVVCAVAALVLFGSDALDWWITRRRQSRHAAGEQPDDELSEDDSVEPTVCEGKAVTAS